MKRFEQTEIRELAEILKNDGVISVPTDTVYGLCARMDSVSAREKLRDIKHRPKTKAFPVMCADLRQAEEIAVVDERAKRIMAKLMPGPLTVILKKKDCVPDFVSGGEPTLAIRLATSEVLKQMILELGVPVYMTSANQSGEKTCETLDEIEAACPGLDGMLEGKTMFGRASTILDCTGELRILREGPLNMEDMKSALKEDDK